MPRKAAEIRCTDEQQYELERLAASRTLEARLVERAKVILLSIEGLQNKDIAQRFSIRPNTVTDIRKRFIKKGIRGLYDQPRPGKPRTYDDEFRDRVLKLLESDPPNGYNNWDGPLIATKLKASNQAVWRLLRKEGIQLSRKRSWSISTEPQFVAKAADIIGLFLSPQLNAMVISVDEKPNKHHMEQRTGYIKVKNGKIGRVYEDTFRRDGTLNLLDALEIATSKALDNGLSDKKRPNFITFMDEIINEMSDKEELHVILDNNCTQEKMDEWLQKHPNVYFHVTPTSDTWFNQIEIWFSIFSTKRLRGIGFKNTTNLRKAIEAYIDYYQNSSKPFIWKKEK